MQDAVRFDDKVLSCLHEVASAAREVPTEAQPPRLRDALASLVAMEVVSTGTVYVPMPERSSYIPGA